MRRIPLLFRLTSAGMLVLVLGACTPGGQFDPTVLLQSDMFDTKKKLQGDREPVFPGGVPGTTTGVPPDLVKGYQPPPDQTDATADGDTAAPQAPPPAEKPKPKPKPRVAVRTPPKPAPTRISIGSKPSAPPQPAASSSQPTGAPGGQSQSVWPDPPQSAPAQQQQQSQSIWPNPPATTSH